VLDDAAAPPALALADAVDRPPGLSDALDPPESPEISTLGKLHAAKVSSAPSAKMIVDRLMDPPQNLSVAHAAAPPAVAEAPSTAGALDCLLPTAASGMPTPSPATAIAPKTLATVDAVRPASEAPRTDEGHTCPMA
jgi:hypothetical protein